MIGYNRQVIGRQAAEFGFIRDTFEKVCRLTELLSCIERDPLLSQYLAFKGGTAINLTIFSLPRLSVDIDLDFAENLPLDAMRERRRIITDTIQAYMAGNGYEHSQKTRLHHSLDSLVYAYTNTGEVRDNIRIEINYSLRSHVLPLERRSIETFDVFSPATVLTVSPLEIFAGKIVALLTRTAARDLYDVNNMILHDLFTREQGETLRKCVVFYTAVAGDSTFDTSDFERLEAITSRRLKTDLAPVIRRQERFNLVAAKEQVKRYLTELLILTDAEHQFLSTFRDGEYCPELLFSEAMLERVKNHPMAAWKMAQKKHNNKGEDSKV
jgi:predicted nucleotidyltransferase component of viral defense system